VYPLDLRNAVRNADKHGPVNRQGLGVGNDNDPAPACTTGPVAGVAMAFQPRIGRSGRGQPSEIASALGGASAGATSDSRPCVAVPVSASVTSASPSTSAHASPSVSPSVSASTPEPEHAISLKLDNGSSQPIGGVELTPPLCQGGGPNGAANVAVYTRYAVRRLTPRECELLQGFPADYTLIDYRNKPAADGPRYRVLGNSMAVPVVAWIGRRIAMMDQLLTEWQRDGSALCGGDGDGHNEPFGLLELAGATADGPKCTRD
jgi:DNA (cytosine-5)-methyltransferase 1